MSDRHFPKVLIEKIFIEFLDYTQANRLNDPLWTKIKSTSVIEDEALWRNAAQSPPAILSEEEEEIVYSYSFLLNNLHHPNAIGLDPYEAHHGHYHGEANANNVPPNNAHHPNAIDLDPHGAHHGNHHGEANTNNVLPKNAYHLSGIDFDSHEAQHANHHGEENPNNVLPNNPFKTSSLSLAEKGVIALLLLGITLFLSQKIINRAQKSRSNNGQPIKKNKKKKKKTKLNTTLSRT